MPAFSPFILSFLDIAEFPPDSALVVPSALRYAGCGYIGLHLI